MAGAHCFANPPVLDPSGGHGIVVDDIGGGLKAYTTGSPDSKLAILFISDVHGFEAPNLRKLADKVATAGFYVVVPDFFRGQAYQAKYNIPILTWVQAHRPDKGFEDAKPVIAALRNKGFTAIGAAGFCWGAKVVAELAKSDEIKAAVMLHPSFVSLDDIKEIKTPLAVLGAEIDNYTSPEVLKQVEEVLSGRPEVYSFVKIYPGTVHGWTTKYDINDEAAVKRAEEAHADLLDWFVKHLKQET